MGDCVFDSYKETCMKLGILEDAGEWEFVLSEAFSSIHGKKAQNLFASMLVFCEIPKPLHLFKAFLNILVDDFRYCFPDCPEQLLECYALHQIEKELSVFSRKLSDFNLPRVDPRDLRKLESMDTDLLLSKTFCEETDFSHKELSEFVDMCCGTGVGSLNSSQRSVFDFVMSKLRNFEQCLLFVDARGGTGKTYTLNAILAAARTISGSETLSPALALATSGIAATQLKGGRTFHSRMRAPLDIKEHSVLDISVQSPFANIVKQSVLIVWDEAPMAHRFLLEALDRSFKDIMENNKPFGGKSIVLAGDFR